MTLDSWLYGNPESVLQAKQERQLKRKQSCAGCINLRSIECINSVWQTRVLTKRENSDFKLSGVNVDAYYVVDSLFRVNVIDGCARRGVF